MNFKMKIIFSIEREILDTAGPLKLAYRYFKGERNVLVLNSDVVCEVDFIRMKEFHELKGRKCTILRTQVDDPSRFGVIVQRDNRIYRKT